MKKLAFALLTGLLLAPNAFAYTMITDPNVFYYFFEKPRKVIDFKELKDGTSYEGIPDRFKPNTFYLAEPDCLIMGTGDKSSAGSFDALAVRPGAFSNVWSFMGADPEKPDSFCEAVIWFDQGISTGNYKMTVAAADGQSQPFAMYTNKGFVGILPDSPQESRFIFDDIHLIFSFETGFSKTAPVSDSKDLLWAHFQADIGLTVA